MSDTIETKDYGFRTELIDYYNINFVQQGWQCPICKAVLAPFIMKCPHNHNEEKTEIKWTHTSSSTTGE